MINLHFHKFRFNKAEITRIDKAMNVVAVVFPITAIPQILQIYVNQDATGVSLATWVMFMVLGLVFLIYSLAHRIKPLILNQVLWLIVDVLIIIGILRYG